MSALLPCPFCDGNAAMTELDERNDRRWWFRSVSCVECDATVEDGIGWSQYHRLPKDEAANQVGAAAAEKWNRRATPSPSPVSAPSPAGGVREALGRVAFLESAILGALDDMGVDGKSVCGLAKANLRFVLGPMQGNPDAPEYSYEAAKAVIIECDEMHGKRSPLRDAALSSPATPEPVSAPANGEVLVERVAEAILAEDWKGRFHPNVQPAVEEMHRDFARAAIAALSNPAPGHGEGGL